MAKARKYKVLGLMSGTSMDGLDLAFVEFTAGKRWSFKLLESATYPYDRHWETTLSTAHTLTGNDLMARHSAYGRYLGEQCQTFLRKNKIDRVDLIASHGHTIFHQPEHGFTFQLGDGAALHAVTGIPVVSDFRSLDVHLGGEGAPLVPMGDRMLFPSYDVCLNLGGIANLSMEVKAKRKAFDVCFCNMALNYLMKEKNKSFDQDGSEASHGEVNQTLFEHMLLAYRFIRKKRKSIGREFFEHAVQPLLDNKAVPLADRLRTVCESVAFEVEDALPAGGNLQLYVTGGGARNKFLIDVMRSRLAGKAVIVLPPKEIIDFKEAIIFAFLGVLRIRNENNVLCSVTRATRDSCSGVLSGAISTED